MSVKQIVKISAHAKQACADIKEGFTIVANKKEKKNNKTLNLLLMAAILLVIVCFAGMAVFLRSQINGERVADAGTAPHADLSNRFIDYKGERYPIKRNLSTILLIGFDSFNDDMNRHVEGANRNRDLSDFLVVLLVDHDEKTLTPLQLNRDTICEIPWLDERGEIGGYHTEQLSFSHTYGSGGEDSAINTVRTVRKLLFNAPINEYVAFTMDVVPLINDLVGGVTLTLTEDLTALDESYAEGAQITLLGEASLRYVRYREMSGGSNWYRMKRHQQYLHAFIEATKTAAQSNPNLAMDAFKLISPYLVTNMSVNNLSALVEQLCKYTVCETLTPGGRAVPGEDFYEFHVDEDSLWDCVYQAYCKKSNP